LPRTRRTALFGPTSEIWRYSDEQKDLIISPDNAENVDIFEETRKTFHLFKFWTVSIITMYFAIFLYIRLYSPITVKDNKQ